MERNEKKIVTVYRDVKDDYLFDGSIMCKDDDRSRKLKYILNHRLSTVDRTIITLYAETASFRKLGKLLGISHMTARREVVRIKKIILKFYDKLR